jgi:hypothetical protein
MKSLKEGMIVSSARQMPQSEIKISKKGKIAL